MEVLNTQQLADLCPSYMFSFTHEGRITALNEPLMKDLGYTESDLEKKLNIGDLLSVGSRIFFQTHLYPLIRMHGSHEELYLSLISKDGKEIPVLINARLRGDAKQHLIFCGGMRISQRHRYEEEILAARHKAEEALADNKVLKELKTALENNQRELEKKLMALRQKNVEQVQINGILSHDLQEPVRKVATFVNLLNMEAAIGPETKAQILEKIRISTEHIRNLLRTIQRYMAVDARHFEQKQTSLSSLLRFAREQAEKELNPRDLRYEIGALPEIRCDGHMIGNVFCELLMNSIKFRDPSKDDLIIRVSADLFEQNIFSQLQEKYVFEEFVRIRFRDNGLGFDSRLSEEVFSLLRKAHYEHPGLGFGLAYCRKVVSLHHGHITASSNPGAGTEITLVLPLAGIHS